MTIPALAQSLIVSESADVLLHMCTVRDWLSVRSSTELTPASLSEVGFVHLSTVEQVHLPANRLFPGREDLVLLVVDSGRLGSPVRWEPGVPGDPESMVFPHLYGPLPTAAVTGVVNYVPDDTGRFGRPDL